MTSAGLVFSSPEVSRPQGRVLTRTKKPPREDKTRGPKDRTVEDFVVVTAVVDGGRFWP